MQLLIASNCAFTHINYKTCKQILFFLPLSFGPSHIRLFLEIIWSRIELFIDIVAVILVIFTCKAHWLKVMRPPLFKLFMIAKRENYMGRHIILALFESEPILHLSVFGIGANIFYPIFFYLGLSCSYHSHWATLRQWEKYLVKDRTIHWYCHDTLRYFTCETL